MKNTPLKYLTSIFFLLVFTTSPLHADIIDEFMGYSGANIFNIEKTFLIKSIFIDGKKRNNGQVIFTNTANILEFKTEKQRILVLSGQGDNGSWMMSDRSKKPMKIANSYNITTNLNPEDIFGIDLKENFKREIINPDGSILLKSKSKKTAFPYITLKKVNPKLFQITHHSINKKPIKEVSYKLGSIGHFIFWTDIKIHDLVFKNIGDVQYTYYAVTEVDVKKSFFHYKNMHKFFNIFK